MKVLKISVFAVMVFSLVLLPALKGFSQDTGKVEKMEREIELEKKLRERVEKEEKKPEIVKGKEEVLPKEEKGPKVLIKQIKVTGATIIPEDKIREIVNPYENKTLTANEMGKVADLITDLYRTKGYITSRAYIPPQDLSSGVLEIKVLEGKMGALDIKGNQYFKKEVYQNKIDIKQGEEFNYNKLRSGLVEINQHPDRSAKATLLPGKERGETDVSLEVKDKLPIHYGFTYDNFGSRFIHRDRLALTLDHNNVTGHDDLLALKLQKAEADTYALRSARYLLPMGNLWELGLFAARTRLKLDEELKDLESRGKSTLLSIFLNRYLYSEENFNMRLTGGFDYKHVRNYLLGAENSRDEMRVLKLGFDFDKFDKYGRTIFVDEFNYGIADLWGGLDEVDARASRTGSGGKFTKWNMYLLRLQNMDFPPGSSLLWKNNLQISPYILTASEQFQVGGITNNRGYPPAEKVGDEGLASSLELSMPAYGLSKDANVPFTQYKLYDAFRIITFYDWGHTNLHNPQSGENKHETLRSAGWGMRLNLPQQDLSMRVEFGWPLDATPSDGNHLRTWLELSKNF